MRTSFEVLPHVSQIICGGEPNLLASRTKSLSLVRTTAFASLAKRKISSSSASRRPKSRIATASILKLLFIQAAIAGGSCASIQIVMPQSKQDDQIFLRHIARRLLYLPFRDQAFLPIFVLLISLKRADQVHRLRECAFLLYRAVLRTVLG